MNQKALTSVYTVTFHVGLHCAGRPYREYVPLFISRTGPDCHCPGRPYRECVPLFISRTGPDCTVLEGLTENVYHSSSAALGQTALCWKALQRMCTTLHQPHWAGLPLSWKALQRMCTTLHQPHWAGLHCAGRPYREYVPLFISSTGPAVIRSHQATTCW